MAREDSEYRLMWKNYLREKNGEEQVIEKTPYFTTLQYAA